MKIPVKNIEGFVKKPPAGALAVLVYGPDAGLIRERISILSKNVLGEKPDPFGTAQFTEGKLLDSPSLLLDEAKSISMLGGRRVVILRDATDKSTAVIKSALSELKDGDNFILIESGELGPKSSLRALFENAENGAALPCYVEDERDISRLLLPAFRAEGYAISSEALLHIASSVVGDRAIVRSEVQKIITYMGANKNISLEDAIACIGDGAVLSLDTLSKSVGLGQFAEADRILSTLLSEGYPPVSLLRALQNHFMRLHITRVRIDRGERMEDAIKKLKPQVFFKLKPSFETQLNAWSSDQIEQALSLLVSAEARCKQSSQDPGITCSRALLALCQMANKIISSAARRRA